VISKQRFVIAVILSIMTLHFMWASHDRPTTTIRGLGVKESYLLKVDASKDYYHHLGSFCNDLPMCFRPLSGWIVAGVYESLFAPILNLKSVMKKRYVLLGMNKSDFTASTSPAASFVVMSCFLFSFMLLFLNFHPLVGFFALVALNSVFLFNFSKGGLVVYDSIMMLFWPLVIIYFSPLASKFKNKKLMAAFFLIGLAASWLMENVGIAFSIAMFLLAISKKYHSKDSKISFWKIYISSSLGTLFALGISWVATHRHHDVFWIFPGRGIEATWDVYSKGDSLRDLLNFSGFMTNRTVVISIITFIIFIIFRNKINVTEDFEKHRLQLWISLACIIGFMCTSFAGLWMGAGFINEYSRQLLPLANMMVWFSFTLVTYFLIKNGDQLRLKLSRNKWK